MLQVLSNQIELSREDGYIITRSIMGMFVEVTNVWRPSHNLTIQNVSIWTLQKLYSSDWHIYINITSFSTTTPCFICQPTRIRYADNPIFYMIISFNKKPWSFLKICIAQLKWCAAQNWESESSHWITADPKSCSLLSLSFRNQSQSRPALSSSIGTPSCSDITLSRFSDDIWQKNDGWIVNQIWVYHSADAFKPDALAERWENC